MSSLNPTAIQKGKVAAGKAAADLVQPGMLIGLGTGSTANYFIESLITRCKEGLRITAVSTSQASMELAAQGNIPLIDINDVTSIDMTIDGADEIDPQKRMIKGGGGAHVREKIVANMSHELVIIVDEHKEVEHLGHIPLPVEILPFAYKATVTHLQRLGFSGSLRLKDEQTLYVTENGNYLYDVHFSEPCDQPEEIEEMILHIPGVLETGFFFDMTSKVIVGYADGHIEIRE